VLDKAGSVVTVAEANFNKSVHWGREIDLANPSTGFTYIATFWPDTSTGIVDLNANPSQRDIRVYNLSGALLKSVTRTDVPVRTVLEQLPEGVYVVKEGSRTYKVYNK
jgi:hypothetical protein